MITDMTSGNPLKHIILFSIPLLIGNIFQQLYNIADLVIVGRTLGVESFAAVGAVAPLFFLITFVIVGLTNGFAVVTGQRYGAKDISGVNGLVVTKLDGSSKGGVLVAAAEEFALPIYFVGVGEQIEDLDEFNAHDYAAALLGL